MDLFQSSIMILEVMGHIAISARIAGGADVILIPEIPYTISNLCERIRLRQLEGQNYFQNIVSVRYLSGRLKIVTRRGQIFAILNLQHL